MCITCNIQSGIASKFVTFVGFIECNNFAASVLRFSNLIFE
jgi:hypothetical protein